MIDFIEKAFLTFKEARNNDYSEEEFKAFFDGMFIVLQVEFELDEIWKAYDEVFK